MLIVMSHTASDEDVGRVITTISDMGYEARPIPGKQRTAIGLIGNDGKVDSGRLEALPGVLQVFNDADLRTADLDAALQRADGPAVVVIDDAELLLNCEAGALLGEIARTGAETGRGLVIAGTTDALTGGFGGWHVDVRRNRQGALLSPQGLGDGELLGAKLSRGQLGPGRPGRAVVHFGDGTLRIVQVPHADAAALRSGEFAAAATR